jgi:hypothetical protein
MRKPYAELLTAVVTLSMAVAPMLAQDSTRSNAESEVESRARLARRAAGLSVGPWQLRGVDAPSGVDVSELPLISGFMRKGLDARLALENGVSVWRRVQTSPATGGIGGTPGEEVQSWVIAQTTAIRFYPATDAGATVEPWILGGAGFSFGIDDRDTQGGGLLGGSTGSSGLVLIPGFSLQGGAGVEWWFSDALAMNVSARFQWTRFFQEFGGERTYQGPAYELGMTYKFQYR